MKAKTANALTVRLAALVAVGVAVQLRAAPPATDPRDVPVRTDPVLKETAVDHQDKPWINPDLPPGEKPELLWVREVWGMTEANLYKNWKGRKKEWAGQPDWYYVWSGIARYKGKLIVGFQEINRAHAYGDSVHHVIVSEDDGITWKSVAHYEFPSVSRPKSNRTAGWLCTKFNIAPDGRLAMTGRSGLGGGGSGTWHATAFSEDGVTWTPFKKWKVKGKVGGTGEIFRPAWYGGRCYGMSRPGGVGADRPSR